jgi:type I restriction enzyme S subunit
MNAAGDATRGWTVVSLLDVADVLLGQSPPGSTYNSDGRGLPFFQGKADFGDDFPIARKWCTAPSRIAEAGDVLISVRAPVGPTNLADTRCAIGRGLAAIRSHDGIPPGLIRYAIQLQESEIASWGTGSTFTAISKRHFKDIRIPLPPEQQRDELVHLLDALLRSRRSARSHLSVAQDFIARVRQSVLLAACSGMLTADWRRNQPLASAPNALSGMLPTRRDEDGLPDTWSRARIGDIAEVKLGGTPSRKVPAYWDGDIPWVSSGEVANCRIVNTREKISSAGLTHSNAKTYPRGTVLVAMIGEGKTRGQAAILDIPATTNQNVAGVLVNPQIATPEYVWRWALAQYEITRAVGRGGNQPALNGQKVRELSIPVPPLAEQEEIVRRIDRLLAQAESIQQRLRLVAIQLDKVSNAVLGSVLGDGLDGAGETASA